MCPARKRPVVNRNATVAGVKITTPERVLYPRLGFTKLDLAKLYAEIGGWALPHVEGRPLTLVRCEHGASTPAALREQCNFLRHGEGWHRWVPPFVRRVHIREQKKLGEYLVIDSLQALIAVLNGDILELHTWNARADDVERPDRLVFDLDPGPDVGWAALVTAALLVRQRLRADGLHSWVRSTGGKGLHVVVPLQPASSWDACYAFARGLALQLALDTGGALTTSFAKSGRRRKILIDYKRNHRTAVSIAGFSTRAHPQGTLCVPLAWDELDPQRPLEPYTVSNVAQRIARWSADPWAGFWRSRQRLPADAAA